MCKITKLFEIMGQRGVKAKELSEAIGASTGNISDWKSGRSSPSIEVLPKIAEFFNVSTDYLLGLDDAANRNEESSASKLTDIEQRMLNAFRNLTPDDRLIEIGRIEGIAERYTPEQKENVS